MGNLTGMELLLALNLVHLVTDNLRLVGLFGLVASGRNDSYTNASNKHDGIIEKKKKIKHISNCDKRTSRSINEVDQRSLSPMRCMQWVSRLNLMILF